MRLGRPVAPAEHRLEMPRESEIGMPDRIRRVQVYGFFEQPARFCQVYLRETAEMPMRPHGPVPRIELIRVFALRLSDPGGADAGRERAGDAPGNLVLH